MASNMFLPKSLAQNLKCMECNHYLSVPPITHNSRGYFCGRCIYYAKLTEPTMHESAYETLAGAIKFPCRFDKYGCKQYLKLDQVDKHENECNFKTIICPITSCNTEVRMYFVLQHFQRIHKLLITTSCKFSLPEVENITVQNLMLVNDKMYILEMCKSGNKCWIALRCLGEKPELQKQVYQVEVKSTENLNVLCLNQQQITYFPEKYSLKSEENLLNIDIIHAVLKSQKFGIQIKFINTAKNQDLLQELECPICSEFMVPPIYICKTGHSICFDCKNKIHECPTCKAQYKGARNFAQENLTELVLYPCKNKNYGCIYMGAAQTIRVHESDCDVKIVECPLKKRCYCSWKGLPQEIFEHSKKAHPSWFRLSHKIHVDVKTGVTPQYHIVTYDDQIFIVCIKREMTMKMIQWSVQHFMWSSSTKSRYHFILNFVDQTGVGRRLTIEEECPHSDDTDHYVVLPYRLLKPFTQNDRKVFFSLDITHVDNKETTE